MKNYIYCSSCGFKNTIKNDYCEDCKQLLHNYEKLGEKAKIDTINELFNKENHDQLKNNALTLEAYEFVIQTIIERGLNNIYYKRNMTPLEKVKSIANAYSIVIYKNNGASYGQYAYNVICIDEKFNSSLQIATLLHELTHLLFNEIIKGILMYYWHVSSTSMLDAYVQTILTIPSVLLISEYCASSTEAEFLPEDYVSYSSFNSICADLNYDRNLILNGFIIGKSMSDSIIQIFNSLIDDKLREDILEEFVKNKTEPIANPIDVDDNAICNPLLRNAYLMELLVKSYEMIDDEEIYPKLEVNRDYYEKAYKKRKQR